MVKRTEYNSSLKFLLALLLAFSPSFSCKTDNSSNSAVGTPVKKFTGEINLTKDSAKVLDLTTMGAPPELEAKAIGLLKSTNGQLVVDVKFDSEIRCMLGDLDIIRADLQANKAREILVTIESVDSGIGPMASARVPIETVLSKGSVPLKFESAPNGAALGLFICSDTALRNSCAGQKAVNIGEYTQVLFVDEETKMSEKDSTLLKSDKVFFFQPIVLQGNSVTFFGTGKASTGPSKMFDNYLAERVSSRSSTANAFSVLDQSMKSFGMSSDGNSLVINLPRADASKCGAPPAGAKEKFDKMLQAAKSAQTKSQGNK